MKMKFNKKTWIVCAIILVLVICVNLIAANLPSSVMKIDATEEQMLEISDESRALLQGISVDSTIYLATNSADTDLWLQEVVRRIAECNGHLRYKIVSTTKASEIAGSSTEIAANSIVVEGLRTVVVNNEDLYNNTYAIDYSTYYTTGQVSSVLQDQRFNAERTITKAVEYATREDIPVVYALLGSSTIEIPSGLYTAMQNTNRELRTLDITDGSVIPEDASAVLLYAPEQDIPSSEADRLIEYITRGGTVILCTDYAKVEWEYFDALTAHYGMEAVPGVVMEADTEKLINSEYPQIYYVEKADTSLSSSELQLIMATCHAIKETETVRSSVSVTPILTTSDVAYIKADVNTLTTMSKEENDVEGKATVAMMARDGEGTLIWFASTDMFQDAVDQNYTGGANTGYLTDALTALNGEIAQSALASAGDVSKEMTETPIEYEDNMDAKMIAFLLVLPACILVLCIVAIPKKSKKKKSMEADA